MRIKALFLALFLTLFSFSESVAIAQQIEDLKEQVKENQTNQERILQLIERLERLEIDNQLNKEVFEYGTPVPSSNSTLVKPAGNSSVSYTQDAVNRQGNSTMIFQYAPNQLYKIYCRVGYLTDLSLKKGEQISFVGGGDTSAWAVNSTTVDGVPHVYIKPTVPTSTTNLIITTNKRSYQLILNTSDWYNRQIRKLRIEIENGTNQVKTFGKSFSTSSVTLTIMNLREKFLM